MATLEIKGHSLVVHVEGIDKLLALTNSITVPLGSVKRVVERPDLKAYYAMEGGAQFRGYQVPNEALAGVLVREGGKGNVFCDVRDARQSVAIELRDQEYAWIVVELSNETPEVARQRIESAIAHLNSPGATGAGAH